MAKRKKLPKRISDFLAENWPADAELAGYVIGIAGRDKTMVVVQGYDSDEVRNKVQRALNEHITSWEPPNVKKPN